MTPQKEAKMRLEAATQVYYSTMYRLIVQALIALREKP